MKTLKHLLFALGLILSFNSFSQVATHYDRFPKTEITPYGEPVLEFYSRSKPYGEFSNFALFPVFVDGKWWGTSEHYYQAQKYESAELVDWVNSAETPEEAAKRGRDETHPKRADWDEVKDAVMEKAVVDKFTRYPELMLLLISTGDSHLIEHTANDCYWADCGDGSGKNKLGLLLEKIRAELKDSRESEFVSHTD